MDAPPEWPVGRAAGMAFLWLCCALASASWLPLLVLCDLTVLELDDEAATYESEPCTIVNTSILLRDFSIEMYVGSWHEVYVSGGDTEPCSTHVFSTASNTISYLEKDFNASTASYTSALGNVQILGEARLLVKPPGSVTWRHYWVVDTDYESFSVVLVCYKDASGVAIQAVKVLSRDYRLPSRQAGTVDAVLAENLDNLTLANMTATDNEGCIPDECPPVQPVAQYLDARQFAGRWYQAEVFLAYPAHEDTALRDCTSWLHSAMPNGSLFLQREVPRTDGSPGRMAILEARPLVDLADDGHFLIQQRISRMARSLLHYDVLEANYDKWALVSVCNRTLYMDHSVDRAVEMYTILLSRCRVGSTLPSHRIDEVLREYDLLGLPANFTMRLDCAGQRCPDWLRVQTPLNRDKLFGDWHVIAETPTRTSTGVCTTHRLRRVSANATSFLLDVIQYSSPGVPPDVTTFELSASQAAPSGGKFNVTAQDDADRPDGPHTPCGSGVPDEFDHYWLLDSDYSNFAVAYTCSGEAKARAWIMSRGLTLSGAAMRHVLDVLVDNSVDTAALSAVAWPAFCSNLPEPPDGPPDDPPHPPAAARAPRSTLASVSVVAVAVLLAAS